MRVGADERIWIRRGRFVLAFLNKNNPRQIFQIHLMNNARVGRDNRQIAKCCLPPAQEAVALLVALEFEQGIHFERVGLTEFVNLHRVVNHQFHGL